MHRHADIRVRRRDLRHAGARHRARRRLPVRRPSCSSPTASATACSSRSPVGASAVLEPSRPNPQLFADRIREHGVTLFFGGPSFWGPLMAADLPRETFATVRNGVSAGEALPARMFHGVARAVRLRDPRRHRLHRGAAHLHLQRGRQGACRAAPASRCRATGWSCAATTARVIDGAGRARDALRGRRVDLHRLLVPHRGEPGGVPGRVDAHRRPVRARRRRQLHAAWAGPTTCSRSAGSG